MTHVNYPTSSVINPITFEKRNLPETIYCLNTNPTILVNFAIMTFRTKGEDSLGHFGNGIVSSSAAEVIRCKFSREDWILLSVGQDEFHSEAGAQQLSQPSLHRWRGTDPPFSSAIRDHALNQTSCTDSYGLSLSFWTRERTSPENQISSQVHAQFNATTIDTTAGTNAVAPQSLNTKLKLTTYGPSATDAPVIHMQQFWYTIRQVEEYKETIRFMIDQREVHFTLDMFRKLLNFPEATIANPFMLPSDFTTIKKFMKMIGYEAECLSATNFFIKHLTRPWQSLFKSSKKEIDIIQLRVVNQVELKLLLRCTSCMMSGHLQEYFRRNSILRRKAVLWMRTQLTDYGFHFDKNFIYCDSKSAIAISCNPVQHSRTKHIVVHYHFIKEHVEKGTIELYFVKKYYQLADIFTKSLPLDRFNYLVRRLDMRSLSPKKLERLAKSQ
ncbi:hypothetical protein Tco_0481804 [Tanacetum coccineum]